MTLQKELMKKKKKWILDYCKDDNKPGSFIAHLYQFIEAKLINAVQKMLERKGHKVAALVLTASTRHGR